MSLSGSASAATSELCGTSAPDKDSSSWSVKTGWAEMRNGPSTSCALVSIATLGSRLDYHCYRAAGTSFWTYLRNDSASPDLYGWVRNTELTDGGSSATC